jgi:hypothetical protein
MDRTRRIHLHTRAGPATSTHHGVLPSIQHPLLELFPWQRCHCYAPFSCFSRHACLKDGCALWCRTACMFRVHSSSVPVVMVCRPTHRDASIHRFQSFPHSPLRKRASRGGLGPHLPILPGSSSGGHGPSKGAGTIFCRQGTAVAVANRCSHSLHTASSLEGGVNAELMILVGDRAAIYFTNSSR